MDRSRSSSVERRGDAGAAVLRRRRRGAALRAGGASGSGMAQPPLSRAIAAARTPARRGAVGAHQPRRSTLTEAGAVLLREGRAALDAVEAAERRTRRAALAAPGQPGVVLVDKAGASSELLAKLLDAYAAEPGAVARRRAAVRGRASRSAAARRPRRRGAAAPAVRLDRRLRHRGAAHRGTGRWSCRPGTPSPRRDQLTLADVADAARPAAAALAAARRHLPGRPGPRGARPHPAAAADRARPEPRWSLPESCRAELRDDLVAVPVSDAPTVTTVIAWPPHSRSRRGRRTGANSEPALDVDR